MKISVVTVVPMVVFIGACQRFYVATTVPGFNDFDEGDGKFAMHRVFSDDAPRVFSVDRALTVLCHFSRKQFEFTSQINSANKRSSFQVLAPIIISCSSTFT